MIIRRIQQEDNAREAALIRAPFDELNMEKRHTVYDDPTAGGWRYVSVDGEACMAERYYVLRLQFDDYQFSAYSFARNDPLCPK